MIDKYLKNGEMFVLYENGVKAVCVVTKEENIIYELKNIAVMLIVSERVMEKDW